MNTRRGKIKKKVFKLISYCVLILLGFVFIYPLLFMISASFKGNQELMTSMSLIPKHVSFENYVNGWKGVGQYSFGHFLKNSGVLVIPVVLLTVMSSSIVAYGFARFRFKGHDLLFILMISTDHYLFRMMDAMPNIMHINLVLEILVDGRFQM